MGREYHNGPDHHKKGIDVGKTTYLFSDREKIRKALKDKFIYLFLDYDGTLAPIAATPDKAVMPKKTKELLSRLSKMPDRKIAIVSGRALADVSKRIGIKNLVYIGNHGFEIKGSTISFKNPVSARYGRVLKEIKKKLEGRLSPIKGIIIEDKGYSLSIHYRLVDKENMPKVEAEFYAAIFLYELRNDVRVKPGKMVLEVRPPVLWDKGRAVLWLLGRKLVAMRGKKKKVLPVYMGDDLTDEDVFVSLKNRGMTIFIGKPKNTKAKFYLKDPGEVADFLEEVARVS